MSVEPLKHGRCPHCRRYIYGDEHICFPVAYPRPTNDDKLVLVCLFFLVIGAGIGIAIGVWL